MGKKYVLAGFHHSEGNSREYGKCASFDGLVSLLESAVLGHGCDIISIRVIENE